MRLVPPSTEKIIKMILTQALCSPQKSFMSGSRLLHRITKRQVLKHLYVIQFKFSISLPRDSSVQQAFLNFFCKRAIVKNKMPTDTICFMLRYSRSFSPLLSCDWCKSQHSETPQL